MTCPAFSPKIQRNDGQTISHYRILENREVAWGWSSNLKTRVCIASLPLKFLPDEVARNQHVLAGFQREAEAASALNRPNICTIYDVAEKDSQVFISMEYLKGVTLKHLVTGRAWAPFVEEGAYWWTPHDPQRKCRNRLWSLFPLTARA